ncbi:MAG: DNA polymerase III subunit delta' [Pseudomonadota bacterium]
MSDTDLPQADREDGSAHPRETEVLIGQDVAEKEFLDSYNDGRLHHAWLLTGPKGIGKATLAWRIARFLIAMPPEAADDGLFGAPEAPVSLDIAPDHPAARRIAAGAEAQLFSLKRPYDEKTKRLKTRITVEEVRKLKGFFQMSAAGGGRRVVIVDAADEMNDQAANALLKILEEPPRHSVLLLVSHQPWRLLPTIRSRCRILRCQPLEEDSIAQALAGAQAGAPITGLSQGSVGDAMRLAQQDGAAAYATLLSLYADPAAFPRPVALKLAESAVGRDSEARLDLLLSLIERFLARLARQGAGVAPVVEAAPGEAALLARLAPDETSARLWAELQAELSQRARRARAVNLDPAALILDMVLRIRDTAARVAA